MASQIPGLLSFEKTKWETETKRSGEVSSILAAVSIHAVDGGKAVQERALTQEEINLACYDLKGFDEVIRKLAIEVKAELERLEQKVPEQEHFDPEDLDEDELFPSGNVVVEHELVKRKPKVKGKK